MRLLNVIGRLTIFNTAIILSLAERALLNLIKSLPPTLKYEAGVIVAGEIS